MFPLSGICGEPLVGLERDEDLASNAIVTSGKRAISDNAVAVWCFIFQFFVDPLSDARVMPAAGAICA